MYKGRYFFRESVYLCGDYMDADIYPVYQPAGKRRKKCKPTKEIQKRLNQRNAERKLTRLVHNNFTEKDLAVHLTYKVMPESEEQAQKDLYNFIRRLKRRYQKYGVELKYISCTEYGKRGGRVHHHLILSGGVSRDEIETLWGKGYANTKRLQFDEEEGIAALTHYMTKDKHFYKRWNQSRNLEIPEPYVRDGAVTMDAMDEMQTVIENKKAWQYFEERFPDYELTEAVSVLNNINHGAYIHFEMHRRKQPSRQRERSFLRAKEERDVSI